MIARASAGRHPSGPPCLYLLYVQLAEIEPPIWRRLAVPGPHTLHGLHEILQAAMPWQDSHLYRFEIGDTRYEDPNRDDRDSSVPDPRAVRLDQLGLVQGGQFQYTYDFGDDWHHDLTVEGVVPLPREVLLPAAWAAHGPVRRKTVEASVAMASWLRRSDDRSRRPLGSTASGWVACTIPRSSISGRSMCVSGSR